MKGLIESGRLAPSVKSDSMVFLIVKNDKKAEIMINWEKKRTTLLMILQ